MSFSADGINPVAENHHGENGNGRRIYPINSLRENPPNLYDDPAKVFIGKEAYKIIVFLATIQSSSVLVFLRHRIGKRVMRGWIFQLSFLILISMGGGIGVLTQIFGVPVPFNGDTSLVFYALFMGLLAWYHYHVARELTETGVPEKLKLHTRAHGDSHLMRLAGTLPNMRIRMWHFYTWRFRSVQVLPLDEPTVQRYVEPLILLVLGGILSLMGSLLGSWLALSALSLVIVESDYQDNAMEALDDQYDSRLESHTMRLIRENLEDKSKKMPAKINGLHTSRIAQVSETLLQLQNQRIASNK